MGAARGCRHRVADDRRDARTTSDSAVRRRASAAAAAKRRSSSPARRCPKRRPSGSMTCERITRREIEQSPSHELDQLLKDVPGLQLFRRSDSRSGHPTSQGVTLRALGGNASSRALAGARRRSADRSVRRLGELAGLRSRTTSAEVRVVRGGGSVANGPGALAGTIEMTSRADGGLSGEVDGGSRGSLEARGRAGLDAGGGVLSLSGRGARSDGFVPVTEAMRGPADERGALSRVEQPRALGRCRSARRPSCRRASTVSTTGARAAPSSR